MQLKSEDNPSDAPTTRNQAVDPELCANFLHSVDLWRRGQHYLKPSAKRPTMSGNLRMAESEDSGCAFDSDEEAGEADLDLF